MNRDAAVAVMQRGLGFRSDLANVCIAALQEAQRELEQRPELPWFLISEYTYRDTVADEERIALPTGYIRGVEDDQLWYYNESATDEEDVWTALRKGDVQYLRRAYPGTGTPKAYAELGAYFRIFPTPDDTYRLKHLFYQKDDVLDSNIENKWLANVPDLLIGAAGQKVADDLHNAEAVTLFAKREQRGMALLSNLSEAREHANQSYLMGDPD